MKSSINEIHDRTALEQQGFSSFDSVHAEIGVGCDTDRFNPNNWDIKTHVLIWFRHLNHDRILARQSAASDCFICAL